MNERDAREGNPTAPPRRERQRAARFQRARAVLFVVVTVCLLQIGWWIYFQVRESGREPDAAERASRIRMAVSEGAFLAAAVLGGVVSIYWLMRRELKREHEQNSLLAAFGHDFRSPLTAMKLAAQSLELERAPPEQRARIVESLLRNTQRLEELVENVLAAARLHAGRLQADPQRLDLAAEVERSLAQRHGLLERSGATLVRHLAPGAAIAADPTLLQSALGNLLDNALKYADGAPHLTVTVERDADHAKVSVTDRGVGFEPSQALSLFDRFQRGDAEADRSKPGLGLGLWLVREIVELHGGSVAAHSGGPGAGATFALAFPLAERPR